MVKKLSNTVDTVERSSIVKDVYTWKGRPSNSKFTPSAQKCMEKLYKKGWTDVEVADFLEITETTISLWKKTHKEFFAQVYDWKDEADSKVEEALYNRALGYSHPETRVMSVSDGKDQGSHIEKIEIERHYPPDTKAIEFWLKNRRGKYWKEKQEVSITGVEMMSDEQIKAAAERIISGQGQVQDKED